MKTIRFDGQSAIVTGAGGGMGQAIAQALGERGARILVNDYGGDTYGGKPSSERAEAEAARLRGLGIEAVADGTPVGTAEAARHIVGQAMKAFGRVDILVNNAGIALPGLITEFSDEQLDKLMRTNFLGAYALVRAAWPIMREQRYGRILSTSSNSSFGIGANAPYSSTKAGLIGLTLDAAIEGKPHGIQVNAMMPTALTRMIEQIPDPNFVDWFRKHFPASKVAAGALSLLARESAVTGRIYAIGGGRMARVAFAETPGWVDLDITPESAAAHVADIENMDKAIFLDTQEQSMMIFTDLFPYAEGAKPFLDQDAVVGSASKD